MPKTVAFSKNAANVFFHILTQCNLHCRHCYINPDQHGAQKLDLTRVEKWLALFARRAPSSNLVLLGGEPTLHSDLPLIVKASRRLGYKSVTIDTNGYLFHNILDKVTPAQVDFFSFSLDGATAGTNDAIRGQGAFQTCTRGIVQAKNMGFRVSLIYTVSQLNLNELVLMPELLTKLEIDHFFIQVIGIRGKAACGDAGRSLDLQVSRGQWERAVPAVAKEAARRGIGVTFPKVYLSPSEPFICAGRVADNYFIFPNGRVYQCPLCEDYPLHGMAIVNDELIAMPKLNETDLFGLDIREGCVMNKLFQPWNLDYDDNGIPVHGIACCLLKQHIDPA